MGEVLEGSASGPGSITFAKDKSGEPKILTGTISAVYVRLNQYTPVTVSDLLQGKSKKSRNMRRKQIGQHVQACVQEPIEREWLGKTARLNLWFDSRYGAAQLAGMDFWVEAEGAQQSQHYLSVTANAKLAEESWNKASKRQEDYAQLFESRFEEWCKSAPGGKVGVYAVRFKGKNQIWKGGGDYADDAPTLPDATPEAALILLRSNRAALWRFPQVAAGGKCKTIDEAQPLVRKPAVALWVPLSVRSLEECGPDENKLQNVLKDTVNQINKIASSQ